MFKFWIWLFWFRRGYLFGAPKSDPMFDAPILEGAKLEDYMTPGEAAWLRNYMMPAGPDQEGPRLADLPAISLTEQAGLPTCGGPDCDTFCVCGSEGDYGR
jgi:hypothetical protein